MSTRANRKRDGSVRRRVLYAVMAACIALLMIVQAIQFQYAGRESPLDHAKTTLLKPFYRLQCQPAWTPATRAVDADTCAARKPKLVMISARKPHERLESFASWQHHDVYMIDTKALSQQLQPRVERECPSHAWAYRLFLIYQHVFTQLLRDFPASPDFVMLEDDAVLADAELMGLEVCRAQHQQLPFFSLFHVPQRQDACIYHSGTVAFYLTREMMERVVTAPRDESCRLPIDIYLATNGPWTATELDIVLHRSQRTGT